MEQKWTITVAAVSKRFGTDVLFHDLNLTIEPGSAIRLYGPNGAGKTQLLLALAGLVPFDRGEILARDSAAYRQISPDPYSRNQYFRYIPESLGGLNSWSIADFCFVFSRELQPLKLTSRSGAVGHFFQPRRTQFEKVVGRALPGDAQVATLSIGQQKRLAIAAAVAGSLLPFALLVDEPLAGLDAQGIGEIITLLSEVRKRGVALVVAEHRVQIEKLDFSEQIDLPYRPDIAPNGASAATIASRNDHLEMSTVHHEDTLTLRGVRAGYSVAMVACDGLKLGPADVATIEGANGAGKTGFLKGLLGVAPATLSGRVNFDGYDVRNLTKGVQVGHVGYMPQDRPTFDGLSVEDALEGAAWMDGSGAPPEIRAVGMRLGPRKRVQHLSAGNRAILTIAQCLACRPRLALLDEPTANVDGTNREAIYDLINMARNRWGTAFLLAEHGDVPIAGAQRFAIARNSSEGLTLQRL
jgi:energy-coupling factor transport system ATP-binding protein